MRDEFGNRYTLENNNNCSTHISFENVCVIIGAIERAGGTKPLPETRTAPQQFVKYPRPRRKCILNIKKFRLQPSPLPSKMFDFIVVWV